MGDETTVQRYAYPPITEVVLELRLGAELHQPKMKKAQDWIKGRYQSAIVESVTETRIDIPTRSATFVDKLPIYRNASRDQTDALTIAAGSVSWIRRAPYEGWNPFFARVEAELPTILKAIGPVPIARIGLRYINRIDVRPSNGVVRYEDYLKFRIDHGPLLDPTGPFQWSLVKPFPDRGLGAIVQSATVEPELPGTMAFAFDIDVYRDIEVPQKDTDILALLPTMRTLKNDIFEAGITDRARELYRA